MGRTLHSHYSGLGSVPGQGITVPQATLYRQNKPSQADTDRKAEHTWPRLQGQGFWSSLHHLSFNFICSSELSLIKRWTGRHGGDLSA